MYTKTVAHIDFSSVGLQTLARCSPSVLLSRQCISAQLHNVRRIRMQCHDIIYVKVLLGERRCCYVRPSVR